MRITLLASSLAPPGREHFLTSFLVGESIAIDAGVLGIALSPEKQGKVAHLLLSHSHADHLATLPVFIENTCFGPGGRAQPLAIYAHSAVHDSLRRDIFNDRLWPDYFRLASEERLAASACPRLIELRDGIPLTIDGVTVTPVAVEHPVPTFGFLLEQGGSAAAIATDTGPTRRLWDLANRCPNLAAVFLDACFPDSMSDLATASGHLTPALFAGEARKLARPARLIAVHIKAPYHQRVVDELLALGLRGLEIGEAGKTYEL